MPVLIDEIAQQLVALAPQDVQCIPAFVDGREEPYSIVNVVSEKDALDSEASDISYWGKSVLPQFEGKILAVGKLALRGDRLDGAHCLRVTTWHPPIIVSADAMVVLARASGAAFDPVVIT
jgi:hypothetical protein